LSGTGALDKSFLQLLLERLGRAPRPRPRPAEGDETAMNSPCL
jgi:hypothetical protein